MDDRGVNTETSNNNTSRDGPTIGSGHVRRNLFQGQLTRRPTPASSSNSQETLRLDTNADGLSDTSEIVVRDQHGEIELGDPPTPILEYAEDAPVDDGHENESKLSCHIDCFTSYCFVDLK
jgi:hypothetical protein